MAAPSAVRPAIRSAIRSITPIALLAALLASAAAAQTPSFTGALTVTATLLEEASHEVPVSIAIVTGEEIARRQATELHQVLATVAGVTVAQSGSPGHSTSAFLRGTNSNHTLVLWNGVPLNESFEGRFDFAFLPLEGVERVEVVRGPFSALYGSALGGVVQVLTRPGTGPAGGRLRAEAGEHEYWRGALAGRRELGQQAGLSLAASVRRGEGEAPNDFYDGEDAALRLDGATGAVRWGAIARFNDSDVGTPFDGATPTPERRTAWRESQLALPLSYSGAAWSGEGLASHTRTELGFRDPDSFFTPRSDSEGATARFRGVVRRAFGAGGWVAGGGEWSEEEVTYTSDFTSSFGPIEDKRRSNRAVFGQARAGFGNWSFEAGVRHDDNGDFGGHTSPRAGALVRLGEGGRLFASYGEAFRAPSFLELYFPFYGNAALEPEVSRSTELGWAWDGPVRFSLTAFENRIRNLIEGPPPLFLAANVGQARTRGGELVASITRSRFDARLAATYLEAENLETGAPLLRRPEESASLVLAWTPPAWTVSTVVRYVGERPDFDPTTFATSPNPSYTRLDLAASHDLGRGLEVLARVENAADRRYEEVLGFAAPGRTFIGGLGWRF